LNLAALGKHLEEMGRTGSIEGAVTILATLEKEHRKVVDSLLKLRGER